MNPESKRLLAVIALMAILWIGEGIAIASTALLPLALFPLLGIMSSKDVAVNYGNHLIFLFLGGFMIALAMEKWNFHKRLALWIICRMGTSPQRIVLGFMAACGFLSMWISNTAATMMMLPVAMGVVRQFAEQSSIAGRKDDETESKIYEGFGLVLMLGLAYSASIGGVGTLIGTPPNIVFAGLYKELYPELGGVSFFRWSLFAIPLVLVFLPLVWLYLCRFVAPFPLGQIEMSAKGNDVVQEQLRAMGAMSDAEKKVAVVFASTAFLWIFRKPISIGDWVIPGWSQLFSNPSWIHDSTVAMASGLLLLLLPVSGRAGMELEGRREYFVLDWKTVERRVPWGVLILFGGGFALASGFGKTGLDHWLGESLSGVGVLPLAITVLLICLSITFLTELTSNTATSTMILPLVAAAAVAAQIHPLMFMAPAALSASFAFMLPVATPPNAIVFGSGWVKIPQMSKAGFALNLTGAFLITFLTLVLVERILIH